MANRNKDFVHIKVDRNYFDKIFEPERRKAQARAGINLTQPAFTQMLWRANVKFKYGRKPAQSRKRGMFASVY